MANAKQSVVSLPFFQSLLSTVGPSGFEEEPAAVFRNYVKGFCDRVETDALGNTIGVLNPDAEFRVMLSGHYDEIGFQVVYINDDGMIYFRANGGIDKLNVPASEVEIIKVYKALAKYFPSWLGYNMAKCGGCIRACVSMLEKPGGCLAGRFHNPLRTGKAWKMER